MLLATLPTTWAVALAAAAALLGALATIVKVRPERESLIAQAAEQATSAISTVLVELRRDLAASKAEVDQLKRREGELLERIEKLEQDARAEIASLRSERRQLLERIAELEAGCHCRDR